MGKNNYTSIIYENGLKYKLFQMFKLDVLYKTLFLNVETCMF